jgi:hypothetical protein
LCFGGSLVQKVCGKVQECSSPVPSTQQFSSDGNRPSLLLKAFARAARHGQLLSRQFYSLYQERHDPVSIHTQLSNTAVSLSITTPVLSDAVVGSAGSRQACSLWLCAAGLQAKLTRTRSSLHHGLLQRQTHSVRCILRRSKLKTVSRARLALDQ